LIAKIIMQFFSAGGGWFVITTREKYECEILAIFERHEQPIGSGALSMMLKEIEFPLSEASVGRLLGEMDRQGWTKKLGYQGRILTDAGKRRLQELRIRKKRLLYSTKLMNSLNVEDKENLIHVLEARRAIERELARLAALNAGGEEIEKIEKSYLAQARQMAQGKISAEQDLDFHRAIASAAKNKVLAAALDVIQQGGQVAPVLEHIRSRVGGNLVVEHKKILDAICSKDPVEAEKRMIEHIESVIADVEKYWLMAAEN
jgi:GntR family L-lactate dehydrogenase operon transcriptional regulator